MEKATSFFAVFFMVILLVVSVQVYAVGSSTGSSDSSTRDDSDMNSDTTQTTNNEQNQETVNCEDRTTQRARIKCRIENRVESSGSSFGPEACRRLNINSREQCNTFYNNIMACYAKEGREKDACFRRVSGFIQASLNDQGRGTDRIRNYIVALLYDLQEKIEDAEASGAITVDEAADLISQIVDIKHAILNKELSRRVIKEMVESFKLEYRAIIGS